MMGYYTSHGRTNLIQLLNHLYVHWTRAVPDLDAIIDPQPRTQCRGQQKPPIGAALTPAGVGGIDGAHDSMECPTKGRNELIQSSAVCLCDNACVDTTKD